MEDSPNSGRQDEKEDDVENDSDDPVEECSDAEAPPSHPPPPREPRTPLGAAGRFASLLGVPHSGSKLAAQNSDEGGDDIIGATQHAPKSLDKEGAATGAEAVEDDAGSIPGTRLTQALEEVMGSFPGNLEDHLAALGGTPLGGGGGDGVNLQEGAAPDWELGGAQLNDDGTMAGGASLQELDPEDEPVDSGEARRPTVAEPFLLPHLAAESEELAAEVEAKVEEEPAPQGGVSEEESDAEDPGTLGAGAAGPAGASMQEALPEEPWMSRPAHERELWERVRPRALRREAAHLRALRLPAAAVSRLMRLNPALQVRSAEALELLNYATLLILQAVARNAARGKAPGQRIQFEDVRQACGGVRELQFLHPLSCTLDASARVLRREDGPAEAEAEAGAEDGGVAGRRQPAPAGPQTEEYDGEDDEDAGRAEGDTPAPRSHAGGRGAGRGAKRKAPGSPQKTAAKSAKAATGGRAKPAGAATGGGLGIAAFFKRVGAAQ